MGRPPEEREIDAVFLAHVPSNHAQYIHFLRLDTPTFYTQEAKIILQIVKETGSSTFSDFVTAMKPSSLNKQKRRVITS